MEMTRDSKASDFIRLMDNFPCMFNMASVKIPSHSKLRSLLQRMELEVGQQEEDLEGEKVKILNIMCWIYFLFGEIKKANEKNEEALEICPQSLISLGNQTYLNWYSNDVVSTCRQRLEKLKTKREFENETLEAQAGQGYFLLRLGGKYNLSSSIQLLTDVTRRQPDNYIWKYLLALASRRAKTLRRDPDIRQTRDIFFDIINNSKNAFLKSLAFSELAAMLANKGTAIPEVMKYIEKATSIFSKNEKTSLNGQNARIFRNCGVALKKKGDSRAIFHLEQAIAARPNNASHHELAKCYANNRMTKSMDRRECDQKAIRHFNKAVDESLETNVHPLLDLANFFRSRNLNDDCEVQCRILRQCWRLDNVLNNPFYVSTVYDNLIHSVTKQEGHVRDDLFDRYLSMALITSLEVFKRRVSQQESMCSALNQILNPSYNNALRGTKDTWKLFVLFNRCRNPRGARQVLVQLNRDRRFGKREIEDEINKLLSEDRPDQALLILDILDLDNDHVPAVSEKLKRKVTLDEAKWELGHGQIACKLLFHRMFNKSYSGQHTSSPDDEDGDGDKHGGADVLILYDAPQWKFFFHDDVDEPREDTESKQHYTMYEDILCHIFDLEVISNPWMPLSADTRVDDEFFALVQHNNIKLILLLTDEHTSDQFLQMANSLLGPFLEDTTFVAAAAMSTGTTPDVAIVSCDGRDCSQKLPRLRDARHFDARENGLVRRWEDLPSDVLSGTQIRDAFFSGKVENALNFFNFLAPPKY